MLIFVVNTTHGANLGHNCEPKAQAFTFLTFDLNTNNKINFAADTANNYQKSFKVRAIYTPLVHLKYK